MQITKLSQSYQILSLLGSSMVQNIPVITKTYDILPKYQVESFVYINHFSDDVEVSNDLIYRQSNPEYQSPN